ncbi:hypothetical protein CR513_31510, partial [Mucuna pruriens]
MEDEAFREGSALILGRPFLMTTRVKIDVHAGTLLMEFGDTFEKYNIFKALKHLAEDHSIFSIDAIDGLLSPQSDRVGQSTPSIEEKDVSPQSNLELKPLPKHLKEQEEKLLVILRRHKKAIDWTLTDLLGINPSIFMHKILLEEDARPIR